MIYRASVMHTPSNTFLGGKLEAISDAGIMVLNGRIVALEDYASLIQKHQVEERRDYFRASFDCAARGKSSIYRTVWR